VTNTTIAKAPSTISTNAAWLAMSAILTYQLLLGVLIFLRPDLDPSWHSISEWAIGRLGWIMSGAFLVSSMSYVSFFVMLKSQLRKPMGRIGVGLLLICAIGAAGAGIFTTDPMPFHPPLSTRGTLHILCGTSQLVLFPFAALLIGLSLARANQVWTRARRLLLWAAWLPMFGFVCFAVYTSLFVVPMGTDAYGPGVNIGWPPRFAFFTYMLWVVIVGSLAIRCSRQPSAEAHSRNEQKDPLPSAKDLSQVQ
jgi:hypothetical membrane protein